MLHEFLVQRGYLSDLLARVYTIRSNGQSVRDVIGVSSCGKVERYVRYRNPYEVWLTCSVQ